MSKWYSSGTVLKGDYTGKNIYWSGKTDRIIIVDGDENGVITHGSIFNTNYKVLEEISSNTVERYEEISSIDNGPNSSAVTNASLLFGTGAGLLAAERTKSSSYNIAIYFKNGKKSLIRLDWAQAYQAFKSEMFSF